MQGVLSEHSADLIGRKIDELHLEDVALIHGGVVYNLKINDG